MFKEINMVFIAMLCFTLVFVVAAVFYGTYMIRAVTALKEAGQKSENDITEAITDALTPNDKTFQFAFLIIIMVVLVYLALGLRGNLQGGILTLIGTLAGYVLGGQKSKAANPVPKSEE